MHRCWEAGPAKGDGGTAELMNCWEELPPLGLGEPLGAAARPLRKRAVAAAFGIMETTQHFTVITKRRSKERKSARDRGRTIASPFPLPRVSPSIFMGKLLRKSAAEGLRHYS